MSGLDLPAPLLRRSMVPANGHGVPPLIARYGPTEATVSVSEWGCDPRQGALRPSATACTQGVPLGRPIAGARLLRARPRAARWCRRARRASCAIAGTCLARGYLARPDLTAAAFMPDPYAGGGAAAGGRLYRTGDLVRLGAAGAFEFLGRIDRQVKIRGFRLELGEVEAALVRHPAVSQAAVVDRDEPAAAAGGWWPTWRGRDAGAGVATPSCATSWPAACPPTWCRRRSPRCPRLPLTANGKLDRAALPAPEIPPAAAASAAGGARGRRRAWTRRATPLEEVLAGLWSGAPRARRGSASDRTFSTSAATSLLATQLVSRVRETWGVELPLRAVFEQPTVAAQAELVAALRGDGGGSARRRRWHRRRRRR